MANIMQMLGFSSAPAANVQPTEVNGQPQPAAPKPVAPNSSAQLENTPAGDDPANKTSGGSPLDKFEALWDPKKVDPKGEVVNSLANVDPQKVMEMANKVDFASSLSPDVMQKIAAGGDEATKAFADALKSVGSNVFAQNTLLTSKLISQALEQQREKIMADLPEMVKQNKFSESLSESHPVLNHKAAAPLKAALSRQFAQQFPDASSKELDTMAKEYLTLLANGLNPPSTETQGKKDGKSKGADTDWSSFLTS